MAIERLIMCVRSGSNSAMYCLTNLVGMESRAQLVVFLFHDQLVHIISGDHFMSYILGVEEYNPLSRWHGRHTVYDL